MNEHDLSDLRAEFDKFVSDKCSLNPEEAVQQNRDVGDKEDDEPVPQFVDALTSRLLADRKSVV